MITLRYTSFDDPAAVPLIESLTREYTARYGPGASREMAKHDGTEFTPPYGALLLVSDGDQVVAGGAFRRYDAHTAELKRIWTAEGHRRRGLARRVVAELEAEATRRGYRRLYLYTGSRQPEAEALYLNLGYRRLPADQEAPYLRRFDKTLDRAG